MVKIRRLSIERGGQNKVEVHTERWSKQGACPYSEEIKTRRKSIQRGGQNKEEVNT